MDITLELKKKLNDKEAKEVAIINYQNLVQNGGTLHYPINYVYYDMSVLAKHDGKVIGYTYLARDSYQSQETGKHKALLYVMQVAVDNEYKHQGVGKAMYGYIHRHMKGYSSLEADVNADNTVSQKFHHSCGFIKFDDDIDRNRYIMLVDKRVSLTLAQAKVETVSLEKSMKR